MWTKYYEKKLFHKLLNERSSVNHSHTSR